MNQNYSINNFKMVLFRTGRKTPIYTVNIYYTVYFTVQIMYYVVYIGYKLMYITCKTF